MELLTDPFAHDGQLRPSVQLRGPRPAGGTYCGIPAEFRANPRYRIGESVLVLLGSGGQRWYSSERL
jgi:hypothetical protein